MSPDNDTDWSLIPFVPAVASKGEWSRFHAFRRLRREEARIDEPILADELLEEHMKLESPTWRTDQHAVEHDDRQVATIVVSRPKPGTPEYESTKHIIYVHLAVSREFRRRGIGTVLLRRALAELDNCEARVLSTHSEEDDGHAFAKWCGVEPTQIERISRLEWQTIDWEQIDRWIDGMATRAPEARLELYPDRLPDEFLEEYCPVRTELLNLMPWDDAEHGEIVVTPDDIRHMYERLEITSAQHHTYVSREPDSTISGITDVSWSPETPDEVEQWFTGVHPDYRGRGLGKALKAAMLRYVDERYESLRWVRTGNSTTNSAMLSINDRLGFREYRIISIYQIERDALASHLEQCAAERPSPTKPSSGDKK